MQRKPGDNWVLSSQQRPAPPAEHPVVVPAEPAQPTRPVTYYAVFVGRRPGIYTSEGMAKAQVVFFNNGMYKKFRKRSDAELWLEDMNALPMRKYYAVRRGRVPGIYTTWSETCDQVYGFSGAIHKSFNTHVDARKFMKEDEVNSEDEDAEEPATAAEDSTTAAAAATASTTAPAPATTPTTSPTSPTPTPTTTQTKKGQKRKRPSTSTSTSAATTPLPSTRAKLSPTTSLGPGKDPLPPSATDGFDPRLHLDPTDGSLQYKDASARRALKMVVTGPADATVLHVYTDGSTLGNGRAGSVGGIGVWFGPRDSRNLSEPLPGSRQTNQRAELTAIKRALAHIPTTSTAVIYSDSSYAINCVTVWFANWRSNNWTTAARKPVENRDLIEGILAVVDERKRFGGVETSFQWVKGHAGGEGNEGADELAVKAAREAKGKAGK